MLVSTSTEILCVAIGVILGVIIGLWLLSEMVKERSKGPWL